MKMKLLERNLWGNNDTWRGKMKNYKVDIETPFRKSSIDIGKFSFIIKTPYGKVYTTHHDELYFSTFEDCYGYVVGWIKDDLENSIEK